MLNPSSSSAELDSLSSWLAGSNQKASRWRIRFTQHAEDNNRHVTFVCLPSHCLTCLCFFFDLRQIFLLKHMHFPTSYAWIFFFFFLWLLVQLFSPQKHILAEENIRERERWNCLHMRHERNLPLAQWLFIFIIMYTFNSMRRLRNVWTENALSQLYPS